MTTQTRQSSLVFGFFALIALCVGGCAFEVPESNESDIDTEPVEETEQALVSCSGQGCNGKDPQSNGCNSDATTKASKLIIDSYSGITLGKVEMRHSVACGGVQWGRVYNYGSQAYSKVALRSKDGSITYSAPVLKTGTYVYSTMRYSPNVQLKADGAIQACIDGCDGGGYSWVIW